MTEPATETDIRQLDPATIERIAAGEVVERPASAVKELLENSLDAQATRVQVAIENGGRDSIRVTDDGIGMSEADVRAAVKKHTTSKIADIDDLEAGIRTLGFRGEALAAIGAVSRMTIRTKPRGGTRGTELYLEGGTIERVEPVGCPEGTTVEVTDLFYNVPARRKYIKRDATEFSHVSNVVSGYALATPETAITLEHNGREIFATPGQGSLEGALLALYGREIAEAMIPLDAEAVPDGPLDELSGVISDPETTRSSPEYLRIYINGRYVTAKTIRDAVLDAYGTQLSPDRYPFTVLFCALPNENIDVNVHPRKQTVRFAQEENVRLQVREAVRTTLLDEGLIRSSAPRGRSAPEQASIEPGSDAADHASDRTATDTETTPRPEPKSEPGQGTGDTNNAEQEPQPSPPAQKTTDPSPSAPSTETANSSAQHAAEQSDASTDHSTPSTQPMEGRVQRSPAQEHSSHPTDKNGVRSPSRKFTSAIEQATLTGDTADEDREFSRLPPLRLLGQVHDTYLVAEAPDSLVLVDQHAADERITYERLRDRLSGETQTQALADPVELNLTADEVTLFEDYADALGQLGFQTSVTGENRVRVTTVPVLIGEAAEPELVRDVLSTFVSTDEVTASEPIDAAADALLADLACYPALTANVSLTDGSMIELLEALDGCENPYACPHGRPVIIELSETELAERFERDYPGHPGRRSE